MGCTRTVKGERARGREAVGRSRSEEVLTPQGQGVASCDLAILFLGRRLGCFVTHGVAGEAR